MAVSYVAATSGSSGSATSTSFVTSLPSGWAAGDLAVLVAHVSGAALTISTPAGWTLLPGITWPVAEGSASRLYAWYRVLQSGDTGPTLSNSGSVTGGWEMTAYRDALSAAQAAPATASGTSVNLPTLTGVAAGAALVVGAHCRVASGTIPTGLTVDAAYTEVVDQATSRATSSANVRMGAAYSVTSSAGTYGGEQVTSDISGSLIGLLVELTPASVDATVAPTGIAATASLGTPTVNGDQVVAPAGITTTAAVGSPAVDGALTISPAGASTTATTGAPTATWSSTAEPAGVPAPLTVGTPVLGWLAAVAPDGLLSPGDVGAPTVGWSASTGPDGLPVDVVLGDPGATAGGLLPDGLAIPVQLGTPTASTAMAVTPDGVTATVSLGAPSVQLPGSGVTRPTGTPVTRPAGTAVVRPVATAVARPTL